MFLETALAESTSGAAGPRTPIASDPQQLSANTSPKHIQEVNPPDAPANPFSLASGAPGVEPDWYSGVSPHNCYRLAATDLSKERIAASSSSMISKMVYSFVICIRS